jgi:dihydrofolate synthase/folylpolyglutamate synthase
MPDTASRRTLGDWLNYLESLHPKTIELGLERVRAVKERLALAPSFPVVTVGGTNGKGSTCAMLESILAAAGYRVGLYTSPHLLAYNERVRIGRAPVDDAALCASFEAVEAARDDTALTYFEFGTLAAAWLMIARRVDVAVLEVGLGGRLDAVNVFEPDVSVVTSVDIDHVDYLGPTRESIGFEKAGIYRRDRPAICADADPPRSLLEHAAAIGADLRRIGVDFGYEAQAGQWRFWQRGQGIGHGRDALPYPALLGAYQLANASAALAALDALADRLPVSQSDVRRGLHEVALPGRFQLLPGRPAVVLDVAHNPHAARALASNLARQPCAGRTLAVLGMLKDKDIAGVIRAVAGQIDQWFLGGLPPPRGATAQGLQTHLAEAGVTDAIVLRDDVVGAYRAACLAASQDDRILVFGSFYTVAAVLAELRPAVSSPTV